MRRGTSERSALASCRPRAARRLFAQSNVDFAALFRRLIDCVVGVDALDGGLLLIRLVVAVVGFVMVAPHFVAANREFAQIDARAVEIDAAIEWPAVILYVAIPHDHGALILGTRIKNLLKHELVVKIAARKSLEKLAAIFGRALIEEESVINLAADAGTYAFYVLDACIDVERVLASILFRVVSRVCLIETINLPETSPLGLGHSIPAQRSRHRL